MATTNKKFVIVFLVTLNSLLIVANVLTAKYSKKIPESTDDSSTLIDETHSVKLDDLSVLSNKKSPVKLTRPTRPPRRSRSTRPLIDINRLTLRPKEVTLPHWKVNEQIVSLPYHSDSSSSIEIDKDGLESMVEEPEAEFLINIKNHSNNFKVPLGSPRRERSAEDAQLNNNEVKTAPDTTVATELNTATNNDTNTNDTKILVNPNTNAINFMKPSPIRPTTEQVEFEAGIPPGWTKPPSKPTRPTRRTKPPRTTRSVILGPPRLTLEPEVLEQEVLNETVSATLVVLNSTTPATNELNGSSTYPPGVSPPEPVIIDSDRGVIDWLLGLVGIRPNPDNNNNNGNSGSHNVPSKGCSKCECGLTYKHNRIVGGVVTQVNEYPWMIALLYSNRFYCGASVINNRYLLTAGHCVNGFDKEKLLAVFLDHDRSTTTETRTFTRRISKVLRHSAYGTGGSYNNDIALLQLSEAVSFDGILKPVCLPQIGKSFTGYTGIATGWGATASHGSVSHKLREVEVPIISNIDCRKTGYGYRITDNMLCAGYPHGTKDSCQGDSGGPLHIVNGTHHVIVGIVSWGEGCAEPNYPGVYTRVNRYLSWIEGNTKDACYC